MNFFRFWYAIPFQTQNSARLWKCFKFCFYLHFWGKIAWRRTKVSMWVLWCSCDSKTCMHLTVRVAYHLIFTWYLTFVFQPIEILYYLRNPSLNAGTLKRKVSLTALTNRHVDPIAKFYKIVNSLNDLQLFSLMCGFFCDASSPKDNPFFSILSQLKMCF